jgi:hypothetical protein
MSDVLGQAIYVLGAPHLPRSVNSFSLEGREISSVDRISLNQGSGGIPSGTDVFLQASKVGQVAYVANHPHKLLREHFLIIDLNH